MIKLINLSDDEPYKKFQKFFLNAQKKGEKNLEAISISSYDPSKKEVNSRFVNLKYIVDQEWIFFTNYHSNKANDFFAHDQVSILIFWQTINTQIRIKAKIFKTSKDFSDKHIKNRSKEKNALGISSYHSKAIESYDEVVSNYEKTLMAMDENIERPDYWGGYSFVPSYIEFWHGMKYRLNKREAFTKEGNGWSKKILQP